MEKFGLLQLLSSFAQTMQENASDTNNNNNTSTTETQRQNYPNGQTSQAPTPQTTMSNSIFSTEIRQKQFSNILLRHEEISRRIDKRNKH